MPYRGVGIIWFSLARGKKIIPSEDDRAMDLRSGLSTIMRMGLCFFSKKHQDIMLRCDCNAADDDVRCVLDG